MARYSFLVVLLLSSGARAQTWNLVWSDEFNDSTINTSNWTYDIGGGGWGNDELEYYTNRPANAAVSNGNLLIIARHESYNGSNYTSARLKTQGLRSFTYGRIEASIRLPQGQGLWPAFWMLGNSIEQVGWPKCGEIDIMEHINEVPHINGTMHWDSAGNHVSSGGEIQCDSVMKYHLYSVQWDPDSIKWFLDGVEYWSGNIANSVKSTDEFHLPFFIILNMAVGGSWPKNPDSTTAFPDTMFVDYVRVYQLATSVGSGSRPPDSYWLGQNYPNPFNPSTTIDFQIAERDHVHLGVYDVLGREVKTLMDSSERAGRYAVRFDGSGLSSGVYFYRLQSGAFVQTKKFMLLK